MANLNENPQHTPAPWQVDEINSTVSVLGEVRYTQQGTLANLTHVCDVNFGTDDLGKWVERNKANARLIVASVNACSSIPVSALESGVVAQMVEALKNNLAMLVHLKAHARWLWDNHNKGMSQEEVETWLHERFAQNQSILSTLNPSDNG